MSGCPVLRKSLGLRGISRYGVLVAEHDSRSGADPRNELWETGSTSEDLWEQCTGNPVSC